MNFIIKAFALFLVFLQNVRIY